MRTREKVRDEWKTKEKEWENAEGYIEIERERDGTATKHRKYGTQTA